jgi:xanthine/CO dehydrogenase XdhC/CoxF family maturation factor
MSRRDDERLVAAIRGVREAGRRAALATVVGVRGSAYRREGARILVRDDGSYECLLSGGCLEPEIARVAAGVIASGVPAIREYDLEADSVWSLGIGCSGAVDILIERLEDDPITSEWLAALERGGAAVLVKRLPAAAGRLLVGEQDASGSLGDPALDRGAIARARARLRAPFAASAVERFGGAELFFDVSQPPPEIAIFGAGPDAEPLARLAWEIGFAVTVVDARAAFLTAERFPHATLVAAPPGQYDRAVALHARSFVVIMNHHLERDRQALRFAIDSPAAYLGVLGPRSRFEKLAAALRADGAAIDSRALARVRSPVGLALGAESPEEIAVSIVGEMIAIQRGFDGGFLAGREGGLHRSRSGSPMAAVEGVEGR